MQELAHNETDSSTGGRRPSGNLPVYTGGCPPAETLAAYIDGVLDPVEAERVTAHLADCEDCYAVYSESLRFLLEAEPEEGEGTVVPFPQRPRVDRHPWLQIAALLVVGVSAGAYFFTPPPALVTDVITDPIPPIQAKPEQETFWRGVTLRGGGEEEVVDEPAFRTGVQLVNLQVALRTGKATEAQDAIARIIGLLKSQYLTNELTQSYEAMTGALEDSQKPNESLVQAKELARETRKVFPDEEASLDLGQWVEAGRLAALANDQSFFQQGEAQSFLRRILWRDRYWPGALELNAGTRQSLEDVSRILSKDELAASDYAKLAEELERVLQIYYPTT